MKKFTAKTRALTAVGAFALLLGSVSPVFAAFFLPGDGVPARETHVWTVTVPAGETRVIVDGNGRTDLDCFVYDRFGNLLGSDTDYTDYCIVDISLRRSGPIEVWIENLGDVSNRYTISLE